MLIHQLMPQHQPSQPEVQHRGVSRHDPDTPQPQTLQQAACCCCCWKKNRLPQCRQASRGPQNQRGRLTGRQAAQAQQQQLHCPHQLQRQQEQAGRHFRIGKQRQKQLKQKMQQLSPLRCGCACRQQKRQHQCLHQLLRVRSLQRASASQQQCRHHCSQQPARTGPASPSLACCGRRP